MTVTAALAAFQAGAEALTELLKFLQTDQCKQYIADIKANHQQIGDFFTKIGTPFKSLADKIKADVTAQGAN